ncbi:MAG: hypothetical protein Q8K37_08480, partial [Alphaproteobacteria bacterium]|nr:hypothetical protein [Alphaproteobacteria bacterium]
MLKKITSFFFLSSLLFSSSLFAINDDEDKKENSFGKRNYDCKDEMPPLKKKKTSKQIIIDALDCVDLDIDKLINIENFFTESEFLLLNDGYSEALQKALIFIATSNVNIDFRLKAAHTLFMSGYNTSVKSHKETSIEAYLYIATDSTIEENIRMNIINFLLQTSVYNEF